MTASLLKRNPDVTTKLLPDGHAVLMNTEVNWAYTLTPLAAMAWEFCDGSNSKDEIIKAVSEIEGITVTESTRAELETLLGELSEAGMLVEA